MKDLVLEASTESKSIVFQTQFRFINDVSLRRKFQIVVFRQVSLIIFLSRHIFAESFSVRFAPD